MVAVHMYPRSALPTLTAVKCAIFLVFLASYGAEARFGTVPVIGDEALILDSNSETGVASLSTGVTADVKIEKFGKCQFILSAETGNLTTEKLVEGSYKEAWSSGKTDLDHPADSFIIELSQEGILTTYLSPASGDEDVVFYETVRQVDMDYDYEDGDFLNNQFRLYMDEDCVLRIYGEVEDSEGDLEYREVWSNMRTAMTTEDVMLQGDIFRGKRRGLPSFMVLQHDCNLVQKYGTDKSDAGSKLWSSGTDESDDDVECWVLVDNAKVRVCVGEFDPSNRKNCNNDGVKIEYSTSKGDWDVVILNGKGFRDATP